MDASKEPIILMKNGDKKRIGSIIKNRVERVNLNTGKSYKQVKAGVETYVGRFVRSYRMGSGDGTTAHLEFNNAGKIITVNEEMWGSLDGEELSYFIEAGSATS